MNYDSCKILLVEDNQLNQKLLCLTLRRYGFVIDIADNGQDAIDMLHHNSYDLILMDIMMPVMDGHATTRKIRELEQSIGRRTIIIGLTANTLDADRERCLQSGMDEYLVKPFNTADFFKALEVVGISK